MPIRVLFKSLREKLSTWNMFASKSTDPAVIHGQILSTRLYLVLVLISVITLTTYASISNRTEKKSVTSPPQSTYEHLQKKYADRLQCSCSKVSIPYGEFVRASPRFHQVCSSDFISQQWISFLSEIDFSFLLPFDVRTSLSAMWQLIRTFCQSSMDATEDALLQLHNSSLVNFMLLTEQLLEARVQSALDLVRQTTAANLLQSVTFVHQIARANQLVSASLTNCIVALEPTSMTHDTGYRHTHIYGIIYIPRNSRVACSCKTNDSCPLPGHIYLSGSWQRLHMYDFNRFEANASVSGLTVDCLPIETTLASSLECFYEQPCLKILLASYPSTINVSILHRSSPSRFLSTAKISQLVDELFLEEIWNETNYRDYYAQCLPSLCTYLHVHRFNWLSVVTVLAGLFGGIAAALRLITPLLIDMVFILKKRFCATQPLDKPSRESSNLTLRVRVKNVLINVQNQIVNLNLFSPNSHDQRRVHSGLLATRLYVCLLIVSVWVLILYSDMSNQIITEKLVDPSEGDYRTLVNAYPSTLVCPCTQISIPYRELIEIDVNYHQICSSVFVQPAWYQHFLFFNTSNTKIDFLSIASSYFQTVRTFCQIANLTLDDAIERFLSRNFLAGQLISNDAFHRQMDSAVSAFIQITKAEFQSRTNFVSTLIHSNQYISHSRISTKLVSTYLNGDTQRVYNSTTTEASVIHGPNRSECYCVLYYTCKLHRRLEHFGETVHFNPLLPGIRGGCSVVTTVVKSSLICWFERECLKQLEMLLSVVNISVLHAVTPLNSTLPSKYNPNALIESVANGMMIEQWSSSYSFAKFYHRCKPASCSFTYEKTTSMIYAVTMIVSLLGGISTVLQLICPLLINIVLAVMKKISPGVPRQQQSSSIYHKILNLFKRLLEKFWTLNIFEDNSTNVETVPRQRISTRIYLFLFSICIHSLTMYTLSIRQTEMQSFPNPSEDDYNQLLQLHSQSLNCPCAKISIELKHFLAMETRFHAVCSSDFVDERWRSLLFKRSRWSQHDRRDLRVRGSFYFSFLSTLCNISRAAIDRAIHEFLNETFFSVAVIDQPAVDTQIKDAIAQMQKKTLAKFSRDFHLLRNLLHGNAFVSAYELNWYWQRGTELNVERVFAHPVRMSTGCSCGTRNDCIDSGGYYDSFSGVQMFAMPGWNVGCSVVETILRSTLECLYNQTCVSLLTSRQFYVYPWGSKPDFVALTASNASHFKADTMIQNIADRLFLEEWHGDIVYSAFYNQCAPASCSYEITRDDYLLYTISKILGLYGGLTVALRFSIPLLVGILFRIRNRCRANTAVVPYR